MSKKVCHITSIHGRYDIRIFMKQCRSLVKNGYDVTLIVNDDKKDETIDGVKIVSTRFKPKGRVDRFLNSRSKLMKNVLEVNADIYQLHDPDLLPIGNKLKKLGKKVIFDSHEDVPMQIKDKQWIPKIVRNTISKVYELYEKSSVKKYDAVISVTPHIVERFKEINNNSVMITNYPIVDNDENIVRKPSKAICFAGGITSQWNHHKIVEAIKYLDDIKYIIAGASTEEYMEQLKTLDGWDKVDYRGRIPFSDVKDIYSESIAGVALNYSEQARGQGTLGNTKLFEFMESKLPVICTNYTLWEEIIEEHKCGIVVDPNNIEVIKDAINYIINNPEEAEAMGENGRQAVLEEYNWEKQNKVLLYVYKSI